MTDGIETSRSSSNPESKKEVSQIIEDTKSKISTLWRKIKDVCGKLSNGKIGEAITALFSEVKSNSSKQESSGEKIEKSDKKEGSNENTDTSQGGSENKNKTPEGIDKEKNTYTNSKSGLTFNLYDQGDSRRGNKRKKNDGKTMNETGCLLTSAAVIHSMIDPSITPDYYRQNYTGMFPYDSIPKASNNKLQSKVLLPGEKNKRPKEKIQQAITEMIKNLEKGYPVEFMVHGPKHGGDNTLTTGQHYMAAIDIREKDGKKEVFIANTHNGKGGGRFSIDKAFASLRQASIYTPTQP